MDISIKNTDTGSGSGEVTQNSVRCFAALDEIVRNGKATFREVAEALAEIHECHLYQEQHGLMGVAE